MIPEELKNKCRFCLWKAERGTKVPYDPQTGQRAATDRLETFSNYEKALAAKITGGNKFSGLGIRIGDGVGAIDIDHCIDTDGGLSKTAQEILKIFSGFYFEKSPSGTGLHGFFILPEDFVYDSDLYYIKHDGLEVYLPGFTNRFITVTGDTFQEGNVGENAEALTEILEKFMKRKTRAVMSDEREHASWFSNEEVIKRATENNEKFNALFNGEWEGLYQSKSEADMALCSILAFWCGGVESQIDEIFRCSKLMRPKWDSSRGESTYGEITIRNAVLFTKDFYQPPQRSTAVEDFAPYATKELKDLRPELAPRYADPQLGLSRLFADFYKHKLRVIEERNVWCVYNGKVWTADVHGKMTAELAKEFFDKCMDYSASIKQTDTRERFVKRVRWLDSRKNRESLIKDAKTTTELQVSVNDFDKSRYDFNCNNGTLNFLTGELRQHSAKDLLMHFSGVDYNPDADSVDFERFIDEIMLGDKELKKFLQKSVAYAFTADTRYECFFVWFGPTTRNGKGTLKSILNKTAGNYGQTMSPETIASKKYVNASGPSENIARLHGVRFVSVSETGQNMQIDTALIKQMTGNDRLIARNLRESSFEFPVLFKIIIDTNHLMTLSDNTIFESNRVYIIPFDRKFTEAEIDINLKDKLTRAENLSAVLKWIAEGVKMYLNEGFQKPKAVEKATMNYRVQSDRVLQFTINHFERTTDGGLSTVEVYAKYVSWCLENSYKAMNSGEFKRRLELLGYQIARKRINGSQNPTPIILNVKWI